MTLTQQARNSLAFCRKAVWFLRSFEMATELVKQIKVVTLLVCNCDVADLKISGKTDCPN
jgi:predicted Rdx family selenoprotein